MEKNTEYARLVDILPESFPSVTKARICIVTQEFLGLNVNGGIGTFYTSLAEALANDGHQITVLYSGSANRSNDPTFLKCQEDCLIKGIEIACLPENWEFGSSKFSFRHRSFKVMRWLEQRDGAFDIVHFPDWEGMGYYPTLLKHQGFALQTTLLVVGLHGPTLWSMDSVRLLNDLRMLDFDFMEAESVRLADVVYGHNRYMVDWVLKQGWAVPKRVYIQQNVVLQSRPETPLILKHPPVTELVFFGRREERKGLGLFCDALERSRLHQRKDICVTFLGKDSFVGGVPSKAYIRGRTKAWRCALKLLTPLRVEDTLAYLSEAGRLAIIPSLIENSPYTVVECLASGIPFLASNVGGIPELIAPEDRDRVCIALRTDAFAQAMREAVAEGVRPARASFDFEKNKTQWCAWHSVLAEQARNQPSVPPVAKASPFVSVVLVHFNRPAYLRQALQSLEKQAYKNFEVILVDCGSTLPAAVALLKALEDDFAPRKWRIVYDQDRYLGAARNLGVRHALGEYVLFMDDDNYARPEEVSTFVAVAQRTGADILTCANENFFSDNAPNPEKSGSHIWLPLGPATAAGVFDNVFGDANALVKKSSFEAIGGFSEDFGVGNEDWEFFAKAVLAGFRLEVIPRVLFWYRRHELRMSNVTQTERSLLRSLRPYVAASQKDIGKVILLAAGYAQKGSVNPLSESGIHPLELIRMGMIGMWTGAVRHFLRWLHYPFQRQA